MIDDMRRLVCVNVSLPRSYEHAGKTVRTRIFKEPVSGRVRVGRLNVAGDGQADLRVHGGPDKAVYAYDLSGYGYWQRELGRELPCGEFGENLTVEGMPDTDVSIGAVYRAGTALFQVTQPRSPCGKLAMKMGVPGFPRAFLASGRTGFYLRVLEEGEIGAGDGISLVAEDPRKIRVREMILLLYREPVDTEGIRRALRIDALPGGLRGELEKRLAANR
jgi:MOSC domain-containing protein YiiM